MCGILGAIVEHEVFARDYELFPNALRSLSARGPDHQEFRIIETAQDSNFKAIFGHTRLSVIDLSEAANQPMTSSCGRYSIVFNGEIYNYLELRQCLSSSGQQFFSNSDTEVLLYALVHWGKNALNRLKGMFAFCLIDRLKQTVLIARDPFGIKPLYYHVRKNSFYFASEVPALLELTQSSRTVNIDRAFDYLVHGSYDHGPASFFAEVQSLVAGHLIEFSLSDARLEITPDRWWWPSVTENINLSFDTVVEKVRSAFLENIRIHLRSDVKIGAALSGGVDSSAVVCAMRHVNPDLEINTFSYIAKGQPGNEEYWVDLVNSQVNAKAHKVYVSADELADDIDAMIMCQGEPFYSTSIYAQYRVFKEARLNGVTVTLDGQGADELLAGYRGYPGPRMRSMLDRHQYLSLLQFLNAWSKWPDRSFASGLQALGAEFLSGPMRDFALRVIGRETMPAWINESYLADKRPQFEPLPGNNINDGVPCRRMMSTLRQTMTGGGLAHLLRHGDRNSMHWSVESRVPFLTGDFAELLLSFPEHWLVSDSGETKHIFKCAMQGIVPAEILKRRDKVGFETPELVWLKSLGSRLQEWLEFGKEIPLFDYQRLEYELVQVLEGKRPFSHHLWRILNFCRWSKMYRVEF